VALVARPLIAWPELALVVAETELPDVATLSAPVIDPPELDTTWELSANDAGDWPPRVAASSMSARTAGENAPSVSDSGGT
jgi:hypothetical protein